MRPEQQDPYAPPPRYKMRSGAVLRFIILAGLLGAAALAYVNFASQPQTASLVPPAQEEQMANADAGYRVAPTPEPAAPTTPGSTAPSARTTAPPAASEPAANENAPSSRTSSGTPG